MPYHYPSIGAPNSDSGLHVVTPDSQDYLACCGLFNRALTYAPAWIAYPYNTREVAQATVKAVNAGLPIAVRSAGHDYEGFSSNNGGAVIDTGRLDSIHVSRDKNRCIVGPGVQLRKVYHTLFGHGLSLPGGTCGSVGVAGLTLGGGFGNLGRLHGLLCDRLRRVQVVDARGDIKESKGSPIQSNLLWACCGGGGGNFGVVTEFEFEPVPVPANITVFSYKWEWNRDSIRTLFPVYEQWAERAPREIGATVVITSESWNTLHFFGQSLLDIETTRDAIADVIGAIQNPIEQTIEVAPFLANMEKYAGTDYASTSWKMASTFSADPISHAGMDALIEALASGPPGTLIEFDALGGAVTDVSVEATAFPHRNQRLLWQFQAYWADPNEALAYRTWIQRAFLSIDPFTSQVSYRNYCDLNLEDWPRRYYLSNYPRLQRVKRELDPENVFRYPQSVQPNAE